jgi:hypothetical protein
MRHENIASGKHTKADENCFDVVTAYTGTKHTPWFVEVGPLGKSPSTIWILDGTELYPVELMLISTTR